MKIWYSKPRGQRIFRCMKGRYLNRRGEFFNHTRPFCITPLDDQLWFNFKKNTWTSWEELGDGPKLGHYYAMSYYGLHNVYSLKAVKRLIYKWQMPRGTKFKIDSPFKGHYFIITV